MAGLVEAIIDIFSSESTYINGALFAAFLAFAASGELVAERAGTLNISVEGMLLGGAFTSAVGYHITDSMLLALFTGVAGGLIVAGVQAEMSHRLSCGPVCRWLDAEHLGVRLGRVSRQRDSARDQACGQMGDPACSATFPIVGQALFGQRWPFYFLYRVAARDVVGAYTGPAGASSCGRSARTPNLPTCRGSMSTSDADRASTTPDSPRGWADGS